MDTVPATERPIGFQTYLKCSTRIHHTLLPLLLEHEEHSVGDTKATKHVDGRYGGCQTTQYASRLALWCRDHQDSAQNDNSRECVARAHELINEIIETTNMQVCNENYVPD